MFGVHGVGGMTGTLLTGVFATASIGGSSGLLEGNPQQLLIQLYGIAVTLVWSAGVTYVLLKLVSAVRAAAGFAAAGAGRPRYLAARRGAAVAIAITIPFRCLAAEHDYVGNLSCLHFRQT